MRATWVPKSLENATWDPFGTKSRPGPLQGAAAGLKDYSQVDLLGRKCRSKAGLWVQSGNSNGSKNVISVACGNIPAPGLGKLVCMREGPVE